MPKNIAEVYEDRDRLLERFNLEIGLPATKEPGARDGEFSYFDGSELGCPVVVENDLAKEWLELNYLFSTGFRPNRRAGVGEIGADIRCSEDSQKYLTVPIGLLYCVVKALNDFRAVEEVCAEWLTNKKEYGEEISGLHKKLKLLSRLHPQLGEFKELFKNVEGYIGFQPVGLPSEDFVSGLEKLSILLKNLSEDETAQEAGRINEKLEKYSSAISQLSGIRKYHKNVPYISDNGIIRIGTPAASGGLCMHTHPAYDNTYNALPSGGDLMILAAQCGTIPVGHIGGGETRGEHYTMHIPAKFFFDEVKQLVDKEGINDETAIIQTKQEVLGRRLDDIMDGEILGFKADGKNGKRIVVLSPVVTSREYERHKGYLESRDLEGKPFEAKEMLLEAGNGYALYAEARDFLIQDIGRPSNME